MENSRKGFSVPVFFGVVALLVVSGGVYYYSQTSITAMALPDKGDASLSDGLDSRKSSEVETAPQKQADTSDQNTVSVQARAPQCADSDGGLNYYVKGTSNYTHGPLGISSDICFTRNPGSTEARQTPQCSPDQGCFVYELFCSATDDLKFEERVCSNGCSDGACVK